MKKLTITLALLAVLVSGAAFADNASDKSAPEATVQSSHTCSVEPTAASCAEICGQIGALAAVDGESLNSALAELLQEKAQEERYATLQADVDILLAAIDFE